MAILTPWRTAIVVAALLVAASAFACGGTKTSHYDEKTAEAEETSAEETSVAKSYTCPMHPEVTSDAPGECPKCGMDLVAKDDEGAGTAHSGK
jgi:hypothetical protein